MNLFVGIKRRSVNRTDSSFFLQIYAKTDESVILQQVFTYAG